MSNEFHGQAQQLPLHYCRAGENPDEVKAELIQRATMVAELLVTEVGALLVDTKMSAREWLEFLVGTDLIIQRLLSPTLTEMEQMVLANHGADRLVELSDKLAAQRQARIEEDMRNGQE